MPLIVIGQNEKRAKADVFFKNYEYAQSIPLYEQVKLKDKTELTVLLFLGDAYFFTSNWAKTVENYELYQNKGGSLPSKQVFRYIHALKGLGEIFKANRVATAYTIEHNSNGVDTLWEEINNTKVSKNDLDIKLTVTTTDFNSTYADMTPAFYGDVLVFASARDTGNLIQRRHGWNQKPFLDLYQVSLNNGKNSKGVPRKLPGATHTIWHESSPVFSKDGLTMYYTSNLPTEKTNTISRLGIYKAVLDRNGDWVKHQLNINGPNFSTAHPWLSPDGRTLYFSSDRPGGFGQTDLYKAVIKEDGNLGVPINLGESINTAGHDSFPFTDEQGHFFFASNGHPGFGGLDIFVVGLKEGKVTTPVFNVGEKLNSTADDFGFILKNDERLAFMTSNRSGGYGDDDIYRVELLEPIVIPSFLRGVVLNSKNKNKVPNAEVLYIDSLRETRISVLSDEMGVFEIELPKGRDQFVVKTYKQGFVPNRKEITPSDYEDDSLTIYLDPEIDLAKTLKLDPIYFDFDKATLLEESKSTLDILVDYLNKYPSLVIEVRSHTDSRGNDGYNLALSGARALSTKDYIVSQGIDPNRLKALGMGETRVKNNCENGVPCTEEEHRLNRRSEFIVLKGMEDKME